MYFPRFTPKRHPPKAKAPHIFEEYAYVLDILYNVEREVGARRRRMWFDQLVQAVGERYFVLLELVPYPMVMLNLGERVYIGSGLRDKIERVLRRISYDELTPIARDNLPQILEKIVLAREKEFVDFFNTARALTPKLHMLELLRGVGKRTLWSIIEAREKKPFESFEDIKNRTKLSDPVKAIVQRIIDELSREQQYYIFVQCKGMSGRI